MILRHERFERNHRLGARIKRMFSLHGSAHPYERLGGESDANPQRHQAGLPNQDDNTAAMIAIQIETRPTFSKRPYEFPALYICVKYRRVDEFWNAGWE